MNPFVPIAFDAIVMVAATAARICGLGPGSDIPPRTPDDLRDADAAHRGARSAATGPEHRGTWPLHARISLM
ncbi:hypothetical protein [Gordonia otitidis]|uniref:hypothetical protein n=1 Tax=Gordonia otitidis TaxID=249058 RepID=UPI0002FF233F|nr:hypothetical protein [Gordonia otitidis]UEA59332.1 hypothetical protein LK459_23030 [Gordonia otitidis]